jgi:hypothetical protein
MFQIAAIIGIARKSGQPYGFEPWFNHDHKDRFGSSEDCDIQKYFVNELPSLNPQLDYEERFINWGYEDLYFPTGNWDLRGHFQSDKWFSNAIDEVRFYFEMKGEQEYPVTAVHYRAGDYGGDYHPRMQVEYYREAMRQVEGPYLVFSDDIEEARTLFYPLNPEVSFSGNDYISDFRVMKGCKNFICANSSYSLMAAILSNQPGKKIVCPRTWFGPAAGLPTEDLYPENSIVI